MYTGLGSSQFYRIYRRMLYHFEKSWLQGRIITMTPGVPTDQSEADGKPGDGTDGGEDVAPLCQGGPCKCPCQGAEQWQDVNHQRSSQNHFLRDADTNLVIDGALHVAGIGRKYPDVATLTVSIAI